MRGTPRGWLLEGEDARQEVDRAIAENTRDCGGEVHVGPTVLKRTVVRGDGAKLEGTVALVLDEDGWWTSYARAHGWQELTPMQMLEMFREMKSDGPDIPGTGTTRTS